jgi:hypothetical protein
VGGMDDTSMYIFCFSFLHMQADEENVLGKKMSLCNLFYESSMVFMCLGTNSLCLQCNGITVGIHLFFLYIEESASYLLKCHLVLII